MLTICAVNTAADSENKIHDDLVAAQFGFRGGLVPGVTVYGYLAAAAVDHFGERWLERGAMDARFLQPVYDGEEIDVVMREGPDARVTFEIAGRATGLAWLSSDLAPVAGEYKEAALPAMRPLASKEALAPATLLGTLASNLDLAQSRMSAPLDPAIGLLRFAHPAVLLALANEILVRNVELGPWIHVASEVRKFGVVRDGDPIAVRDGDAQLF